MKKTARAELIKQIVFGVLLVVGVALLAHYLR